MFRHITLKNYRTHMDTHIELGPVTLLIGSNNAGKSNLLEGLRHFSRLTARGRPQVEEDSRQSGRQGRVRKPMDGKLRRSDIVERHRLSEYEKPMTFSCSWTHQLGEVEYEIELFPADNLREGVACRQKIRLLTEGKIKEISVGSGNPINDIRLEKSLASEDLRSKERSLAQYFFQDLSGIYSYNFQPSFLKGEKFEGYTVVDPDHIRIPSQLGISFAV